MLDTVVLSLAESALVCDEVGQGPEHRVTDLAFVHQVDLVQQDLLHVPSGRFKCMDDLSGSRDGGLDGRSEL